MPSPAERLAQLTRTERNRVLDALPDIEQRRFPYAWREWWARENQLPPSTSWHIWLVLAGRGFGKTRTGAEWVREQAETGKARRIALVAPTVGDIRKVLIEGPSGILNISPPEKRPIYEPSKGHRLTWPNGAVAFGYSADEPDRLRGPEHDAAWCDELAAWRYAEAWDNLQFGLRIGDPHVVVTTTPRPVKLVRQLLAESDVSVTRGSTYANRSNLSPKFFKSIIKKYEGTRLGRQEIDAELLEDVAGALWNRKLIEDLRIRRLPDDPKFRLSRVVVAIDPAASAGEDSDETGIITAALGSDGNAYVLDDHSGRYLPHEWAEKAIKAYHDHRGDRIVAEINNGGQMVEATLRMAAKGGMPVSYKGIHASRGKVTRAEPVAALYEKRMVHHLGAFPALEDQMCAFTGDVDRRVMGSPDRVDALVWVLTELMVDATSSAIKPLRL